MRRIVGRPLESVLQRLTVEGQSRFGATVVRIEPERVVSRPFSAVLRARVVTAAGDKVVYCKVFLSPAGDPTSADRLRFRVEREFRETQRAYHAFAGIPGFAPLEPIAVFPDLLALVTCEIKGESFSTLLSRTCRVWSRGDLQDTIRAGELAGEWLRTYQQMPTEPQQLSIDELREYVDVRLRRLEREAAPGFNSTRRREILAEFEACAAPLKPTDLTAVSVHADFCPENILVDQGVLSVIDFAMAKRGLRHLDLSHLLIHLAFRRGAAWNRRSLALVRRASLEGYGDPGLAESPGFRLAVLVHVSALLADRLNRAAGFHAARKLWLGSQVRRCLEFVHA
jgi:hypothetical protein